MASRFFEALECQVAMLRGFQSSLHERRGDERRLAESLVEMLSRAEPYYWDRDICEFIQGASASLPPTWAFSPEMCPTQYGFMFFARPVGWKDAEFGLAWLGALAWAGGTNPYTGKRSVNVCSFREGEGGELFPSITGHMDESETILEVGKNSNLDGQDLLTAMTGLTIFATCLTFIGQRILVTPKRTVERHARRRLEREGDVHEPLVRVVELRRTQARSEHHGESEPVEWSHQWIVSGHWRQQWYPSLNAHQPRWVMPYVKGPEDKPLKPPRAKVFAVVR